jgi:release factor H-coupled RctB family protein
MGTNTEVNDGPRDGAGLPAHARVVSGDGVWMEGDALVQLGRVARLPGCRRAVGMPDLHPGRGIPVGAVFAFDDVVYPGLIGDDAGCGVRVVATRVEARAPERLVERVRAAFAEEPLADCDPEALCEQVWRLGPRGLVGLEGVPEALAELAEGEPGPGDDGLGPSGALGRYVADGGTAAFLRALGSVGGGNHFAEITRVSQVEDGATARAAGLGPGTVVVMAHSGSRGLGGLIGRHWGPEVLTGDAIARYLGELAGACRYARTNRLILAYRLLRALGAARPSRIGGGLELVHNDVRRERLEDGSEVWVHRKGAAPARAGELTVVLGSRGAPSWVLEGCGDATALASVAHGAGRRMGRSEARAKIKARYRRAELGRTKLGSHVVCDDPELLYEEHPDAYKAIAPVVEALIGSGLARRVAMLTPLVTVKQ